jgi:hypothetical protein
MGKSQEHLTNGKNAAGRRKIGHVATNMVVVSRSLCTIIWTLFASVVFVAVASHREEYTN